jgi:hypothetical protein
MTGFDQDAVMDRMLGIGEECRASIAEISAAAAAPQGVKA